MLKTIGSDMEVFAKNKDGHHVALCGKIGGTKEQPLQLEGLKKGFMVQEDNVALEFNIPICKERVEFVTAMHIMRQKTSDILNSMGLSFSEEASVTFAVKELAHPNALIFGCEPDYDAWSKCENQKPYSKNQELRTCGGHIHVGTDINMIKGVRNMDLFLGIPAVLLDDKPSSIVRRELYGKAGAMRPKPYGFEYRTLSNFWMFSDSLVKWIYDQAVLACSYKKDITETEGKKIRECINTGNKTLAQELIEKYSINLPIVVI